MYKALGSLAFLVAMPAAVAVAADMPVKAPASPSVGYSWSGLYLGGQIGEGWATSQTTLVTVSGATFPAGTVLSPIDQSGVLGGAYAGYNYQINQVVLGIDGDYSRANLTGAGTDISVVNGDTAHHFNSINWISTVAGRLGYADRDWLFFAKAGWAWAGFSNNNVTNNPAGGIDSISTHSETRNGGIIGGGAEWGWSPKLSLKLEYDYVKFSTANFIITQTSSTGVVSFPTGSGTSHMDMLKAGMAYRF
jgi:outer membrane immunogenic protein